MPTGHRERPPLTTPGYVIVLTLINNVGANKTHGGKVAMVGTIEWPDTPEGQQDRDATYDAFPTHPKRTSKRFEASIDRVNVGDSLSRTGLDLEQTRRIPPSVAERIIGCSLSEGFAAVRAGGAVATISPEALAEAINSGTD